LLIYVLVLGDDTTFLHENAGDHDVAADYKLALQERIQLLEFYGIPRNMPQFRFGAARGNPALLEDTVLAPARYGRFPRFVLCCCPSSAD
jgi:hypothetical protein